MMPNRDPLRPGRVLMTADTVGGVWDYALELAGGLAPRGVAVTLATMGRPPSDIQRQRAQRVPGLELRESSFRLEWMDRPEADLDRAADWLLDLAAEIRPDLIHLNGYTHAALPWGAPAMVVAHSCVQSWWRAVHGAPPPPEWDAYTIRVGRGLAAADLVIAPTRSLLESVEDIYGPLADTRVIWNGRDPLAWAPQPKENMILTAGRLWDEAKNIGALDAVADRLAWPILAAGGWQRPDGTGTPPAHLTCLGVLGADDMARYYGRAAIFALPARYEPFGLSVLEAALAGCALVLGDIPSLRELWDGAAEFVEPDDHDELADRLRRLIADPERRGRFGQMARLRARSYGADRMCARYLDVYADLLDRPRAVRRRTATAALKS